MWQEIRVNNIGRAIYKQITDISVACTVFCYRQVFTTKFFIKIVLDSFVFLFRKIEKGFKTDIYIYCDIFKKVPYYHSVLPLTVTLVWQEFLRKKKQKRDIEKYLKRWLHSHFLFAQNTFLQIEYFFLSGRFSFCPAKILSLSDKCPAALQKISRRLWDATEIWRQLQVSCHYDHR